MDAKEKKDRADQTARRVYDILKNHDQEMSTIEAQIDAERAALEEDLEAIRARAYPRGVRYDTPRVQSSPDPDGLLVKVADAIQRRTARTKRATDALEERQRQIENVHEAILTMDAKSKIVLLTLYYPRRTYVYNRDDPEGGMFVGPKGGYVRGHFTMERAVKRTKNNQQARVSRKITREINKRMK